MNETILLSESQNALGEQNKLVQDTLISLKDQYPDFTFTHEQEEEKEKDVVVLIKDTISSSNGKREGFEVIYSHEPETHELDLAITPRSDVNDTIGFIAVAVFCLSFIVGIIILVLGIIEDGFPEGKIFLTLIMFFFVLVIGSLIPSGIVYLALQALLTPILYSSRQRNKDRIPKVMLIALSTTQMKQ